jgi:hypothetical protein
MLDGTLIANDTFFFCVLGLVLLGVFALCAYSKRLSNSKRVGRAELIDETTDGQDTINDSRFHSSGEDIEVDYSVKRGRQVASTSEIELESRPYKAKPASEESEEASGDEEEGSEEEVSQEEEEEEEVSDEEEEEKDEVQLDKE